MEGNGPGGAFNGGVFGGGPDSGTQLYGGRFDMEMGVVWTLNNLGAGNRSLVRERIAKNRRPRSSSPTSKIKWLRKWSKHMPNSRRRRPRSTTPMTAVKEAAITYNGTLRGIGETRGAGDLLQLVNRPQEAVAAFQQLNRAYDNYFAAINGYNRAQFQLYCALGFPARIVVCDHPVGDVQPLDTSRPQGMAPVCPHVLSRPSGLIPSSAIS